MKTKLVPANLTVETFIQRVMTGESFYTKKGSRAYYHTTHDSHAPFRYQVTSQHCHVFDVWHLIPELLEKVEVSWKDEVSEENPILCWVSDRDSEKRKMIAFIVHINPENHYAYVTTDGDHWMYATPVLRSECRQEEQTK